VPVAEPSLVEKILAVHDALERAAVAHAFGGALALAYYTHDPRATADIDVNVSLDAGGAVDLFDVLPEGVAWSDADLRRAHLDEQVRLWWGRTPVDLFFRASAFHDGVARRTEWKPFAGMLLPFVAAVDLAVFKALYDRPKDWVDLVDMCEAGSLDAADAATTLASLIGEDDRVEKLRSLAG
jgi:hypothetical protein